MKSKISFYIFYCVFVMVFKKRIDVGKSFLLPVIPVIEIVVFPNTIVPLFVNRRISIKALEQAINTNSDVLIVSQTERLFDERINIEKLPKVGTICKIIQSMKLPDGTMKITLDCICRGSIEEYTKTDGKRKPHHSLRRTSCRPGT